MLLYPSQCVSVHMSVCMSVEHQQHCPVPDITVVSMKIWSNLGDAMVSMGEQLTEAGRIEEGQGHFMRALQAYDRSCSLSDSQQGDDLPGLLHNWGVGLHSFAAHTQVRSGTSIIKSFFRFCFW